MAFDDLRGMLGAPKLKLPIGGRTYVVEPATAETWLKLQEVNARATAVISGKGDEGEDISEPELYRLALGDAFDHMVKGVSGAELKHAGITAYYWQLGQDSVAEAVWADVGKAEKPTPKRSRSTSTSTGAATTTKRRASTSSTTTRQT